MRKEPCPFKIGDIVTIKKYNGNLSNDDLYASLVGVRCEVTNITESGLGIVKYWVFLNNMSNGISYSCCGFYKDENNEQRIKEQIIKEIWNI